jgi:hypothetical protein
MEYFQARASALYRAEDVAVATTCRTCHETISDDVNTCPRCGSEVSGPLRATYPVASAKHPTVPSVFAARKPLARIPDAIILRLVTGQRFVLRGQTRYAVGRRGIGRELPYVDLAQVHGWELGVSRAHLAIYQRPDGVFVEDVGSRSDTILNGYRLGNNQLYALRDGDELKLGGIVMSVEFQYD